MGVELSKGAGPMMIELRGLCAGMQKREEIRLYFFG